VLASWWNVLTARCEKLLGRHGSPRGRFWLSVSPIVGVFAYVEWLLLTGKQSFTSPLSFLGVLAAPLIADVFPFLLLVASRAKGDRPARRYFGWLGNPAVIDGLYVLFAANLFVHGFLIWQDPVDSPVNSVFSIAEGPVDLEMELLSSSGDFPGTEKSICRGGGCNRWVR
jgi:hypothetical protein